MHKTMTWTATAIVYFVEEETGVEYEPGEVVDGISLARAKRLAKLGYVSLVTRMQVRPGPESMKSMEVCDGN